MLASSYPFMDVFWTMFAFFAWVLWIYILIMTLSDVFKRADLGGGAKVGWTAFVIFLPLLGVLVYMMARPAGPGPIVA